jgi:magnesium chelatase family protein
VANLVPVDLPKEGSRHDSGDGVIAPESLTEWAAVGELGLDGQIAPVAADAVCLGLI